MRALHSCIPPSRKIPLEVEFAEWVWKCPKCKQRWHVRQFGGGGMKSDRIWPRRFMRLNP